MRVFLLSILALIFAVNGQDLQLRSCPRNEAFVHNGFLYQFFDCPLNWQDAENACKNQMVVNGHQINGGHLISILNEEEKDWVKFQLDMRYGTKIGIWLGVKRQNPSSGSCPNNFQWTDGNRFSYQNFLSGQPNCRWSGENCLHIIDNERWNDAECQGYMRFICKAKRSNFDIDES